MVDLPPPDLHVRSLTYSLRSGAECDYVDPPPLEFEQQGVKFRLASGELTCELMTHCSNVEDARAVVEPILRAWELDSDLNNRPGEIRFHLRGTDVVDRAPLPAGVIRGTAYIVQSHPLMAATGTISVHVTRGKYPAPPPETFRVNADIEALLARYQGYLAGQEPLLSMAYFCLTFIEKKSGSRRDAARQFAIDIRVLQLMGELSSTRGDRLTARKARAVGKFRPAETKWLETVVKLLLKRLGDCRPANQLKQIQMSDLPRL